MRKVIAIILICIGLSMAVLSVREYAGKNKRVNLLGYELTFKNKESKKVFYRNTGIGVLILAGGVFLIVSGKKK